MAALKLVPRLDDGSKSYYKRVERFLDGEEHDEEGDAHLFLENVIKQIISDDAKRVCCDKDGSRAVERLLHHQMTDLGTIKKLMVALSAHCGELSMNRCGSHVIEALLKAVASQLPLSTTAEGSKESTDVDTEDLMDGFLTLCSMLRDNVAEFIVQPYASHVLSSLVQVLSGVYFTDHASRSRSSREFRKAKMAEDSNHRGVLRVDKVIQTPSVFLKQLNSVAKRISKIETFSQLLTHQCACPALQTILRVLSQRIPERANKLMKKIIKCSMVLCRQGRGCADLEPIFTDSVGSHLMECMIEVASPELKQHIFDSCFKGRVMTFALHPVANYPLQQLISSATPQQVASLIEETSSVEDILFAGHTGVVVKLTQAAVSCSEKQALLLDSLLKAFHTEDDVDHCVPVFISLMTHDLVFEGNDETKASLLKEISLHGSLLVQALLKFQVPKVVVNSLLKMPSDDIIGRLSCDQSGSHVITTFLSSPTVSPKKKNKLTKMLKSSLIMLCKDRHGSRVVDVLWRQSEVQQKQELAEQLIIHEEDLSSNYYGKIILRNCNIAHYKKKQQAWQDVERATEKKRDLFQDILEDTPALGSEKKRTQIGDKRKREEQNLMVVDTKVRKM